MKLLYLTEVYVLLFLNFCEVPGQQSGLPDHYPKFLKNGRFAQSFNQPHREFDSGPKTSGTKSFSKTSYSKTGSTYNSYGNSGNRYPQSHGSYGAPAKLMQYQGGCTTQPRPSLNSHLRCSLTGCNATCMSGYQFPDGQTRLSLQCQGGTWLVSRPDWLGVMVGEYSNIIPIACEPICEPACENNGICYEPNRCNCPENFSGVRCENSRKPCLNYPALPMSSRRTCSTTHCTVSCLKGYEFPDGSAIANLNCQNGNWIPTRTDWTSVPDCRLRGVPCTAKLLGFNGGYNCSGDIEYYKCSVKCPTGIPFEFEPAEVYICKHGSGVFSPQPIPKCLYDQNVDIVSIHGEKQSYSHSKSSYQTSVSEFLSNTTKLGEKQLLTVEARPPGPGTCYTWGGAHYKTFDGALFSSATDCPHVLIRDVSDNSFSVLVASSEGCKQSGAHHCYQMVYIYIQDKLYLLTQAEPNVPALFSPPGHRLSIPSQFRGLKASRRGHFIVLDLEPIGVTLKWDGKHLIQITINEFMWNRTEGLCGRHDGDKTNDLFTKDGSKAKTTSSLVDSWKVNILDHSCDEIPSVDAPFCAASKTLESRAHQFCTQLLSDKRFASCLNALDADLLIDACKWDFCACEDAEDPSGCGCDTMSVLIRECREKALGDHNNIGLELIHWRSEQICPLKCSGGRIYKPCDPNKDSHPTCGFTDSSQHESSGADCEEGCFCPPGTVLHGEECIDPESCPCSLRGREFAPGASVPKECNTCTCQAGKWTCSALECGARCSAIGDPHYQTFDGKTFDFMGQCQYYLVKGSNFSIEAENIACAGAISQSMNFPLNLAAGLPSCTRTVTVRTTSGHTIRLKQNREVTVDGHDVLHLPFSIGDSGDVVRIASSIFIVLELENGLEIWWDGVTRVYIDAPASFRDKTKGLCGTFNHNQWDDFLTPEGDVELAVEAFANKWKVDERCPDRNQTQHSKNHPCDVNIYNKKTAEDFCKTIHSKVFKKCHWLVDPQQYYEDCLYDMCSCQVSKVSNCLCPTLASYGSACAAAGAGVPWRTEVPECGISCPSGQVYQACGNSCTRSCSDLSLRSKCRSTCVEGCNCPLGEALDDQGECIPIDQCPCVQDGLQFSPGYKEIRSSSLAQELCSCVNAVWHCYPASRDEIVKHPKENDRKTICSVDNNQEFTTCEPEVPETCKNMHDFVEFSSTKAHCQSGCKCRDGFVLLEAMGGSGKCVRPHDCPCHHGGRSYHDGQSVRNNCNNCTCQQGTWNCTKKVCPSICSSWGDSHFTTFDNRDFDYQGQCDLILSKGALGKHDSFEISIQNVLCGSLGVSCSKSVSISVSGEKVTLNRDKKIPTHQTFRRMSLHQTDLYVIVEAADLGLSVTWDKGTRVSVRVEPRWKGRLKGLCGNYNDDQQDDFQTPSGGFSEVSPLIFGDSWRVNPACPPGADVPDTCAARPERKTWAVKECGVLKSDVFGPCHQHVPFTKFFERCVFDACACDQGGDCECLCTALAAYAQECNHRGVYIKWRSQQLCPLQCDERCSEYSPCMSPCPRETCDNLLSLSRLGQLCASETCLEGCLPKPCPEHQVYLNSSALECVPRATCKPICMEINGVEYSEGDLIEEDECHRCHCTRLKKVCSGKPCAGSIAGGTTTPGPYLDQVVKCQSGWTKWFNQDQAHSKNQFKNGKKFDIEPIPNNILLNSQQQEDSFQFGRCAPASMSDIECRTVNGHIDPKATGLDVECSLERGLICKADKQKNIRCPDFEIRILCQCEQQKPQTFDNIIESEEPSMCDPSADSPTAYRQHNADCHAFYQCYQSNSGAAYIEKNCGPSMWFNPRTQTCDWPQKVLEIRPECETISRTSNRPPQPKPIISESDFDFSDIKSLCPPGFIYRECGTECHRLCLFYTHVVREKGLCLTGSACEAGCVKESRILACPPGSLWRDNTTCVEIQDCVCRAHDGTPVRPGTLHHESNCEFCQCIDNHYICDRSACTTPSPTTLESIQLTTIFNQAMLPAATLRPIETPAELCDEEHYINLLAPTADWPISDVAFSASSVLNEAHQPWHARSGAKLPTSSAGAWAPQFNNGDQYVQVDLGRVEPVYGVVLLGHPLYDNFVTSFQLLYTSESSPRDFKYAVTKSGVPQLFRGSVDQRMPVKAFLEVPVEARYIRINPKTWHNEISLRLDVIGCADLHFTTTVAPQEVQVTALTKIEEVMCDDPMGVDNNLLDDKQIFVSSEKVVKLPKHGLKMNSSDIWRPLANTPNEWAKFDFEGPRQLTGIKSHGGPTGWVSAYKVQYSHNDLNWNPIVDDYGNEILFPGNFDQDTIFTNMFKKPIKAQFLRIEPKKWTSNIQMAVEPLGCFEPYQQSSSEESTETIGVECQHCPGIDAPITETVSERCLCDGPHYWDGNQCILRAQCPCRLGLLSYPVGTVFEKEDCSECLCALGGVAQCAPKRCEPCSEGLRSTVTPTCGCVCKPCPTGEVLCPTSNICINQTSWCDGIVECPDDEVNCAVLAIEEPLILKKKKMKPECPPVVCPPGFKIQLKKDELQKNLSPMFQMYGGRKTKQNHNKMAARYYGTKGSRIIPSRTLPRKPLKLSHTTIKNKQHQICAEFVCEPPSKTSDKCAEPSCPPGYTISYLETFDEIENHCESYECHPPPVRDDICNITGRTFNTFDGTEFKYDICNHLIARDLHFDDWDIILVKNCSDICSRDLTIRHGDHILKLFSDLSIEFNGYRYTAEQISKIGANNLAFIVSRMGDTLLFVSNHYGFWIMWNKQGNVKIGVTEKLIGQVDGLCGFYDKNPKNDKRKADGRQSKTTIQFGDSWRTGDQQQNADVCTVRTCPLHVQNLAFEMCQAVKERILAPCQHTLEDIDGWISRCLETTCGCLEQAKSGNQTITSHERDNKCRCEVLEAFIVECTTNKPNIELEDWRMEMECPASCEAPLVHHDCYRRRCEPSCSNLAEVDACPTLPNLCFPGCYCPAGLVRKKDKCVVPRECRDCECNVLPHLEYITYDGANHTVNTNCTYLMSRERIPKDSKKSSDFEVFVSNGPCVLNPSKMCTSVLTLLVNNHRIEIERGPTAEADHQVSIDDLQVETIPFDNDWVEITRLPARHLNILIPKLQIEFRAYYPTLGASLRVPSHSYGAYLEGICGDCDRNPDNDNKTPNNETVLENDFVKSWQNGTGDCFEEEVKDCQQNDQDPCLVLLDADRFAQCHLLLDPAIFLSTCWHETCGGNFKSVCSSLETYSIGCRAQGLCIDYHTELCPAKTCPPGTEYALCGPPCIPTCEKPHGCTKGLPKEGCFCPPGLVLKNNTECVEERECFPCDDEGHFPGDSWVPDSCTTCSCDNTTKTIRCETKSCPMVDTVCDEGFEPVKIKTSNAECCEKFACVPANTTKPECEEPKALQCAADQIRKLEKRPDGCLDYVCQCKAAEDCPVLSPNHETTLAVGIERVLDDSGCCQRENFICRKEKCPKPPTCAKFYSAERQAIVEGDCCPTYKCLPPADKCLFTKSFTAADAGGERPLTQLEQEIIVLEENATVSDGPCRVCKCVRQSESSLGPSCTVTECPGVNATSGANEYVLESIWSRGECCPKYKKIACLFEDGVKDPGEKWPLNAIKEPCTILECKQEDEVTLMRHIVTCDTKCKPGFEYLSSLEGSGECCGICKQTDCVIEGKVRPIGAQWASDDFCTEYTCSSDNGTVFVSRKQISCPKPAEELLQEFVYEYRPTEGECCGRYESIACLVGGAEYLIGSTWPDPAGDPCVTVSCLHAGAGASDLTHQRTVQSCNQDCHPGWKYAPPGAEDICCGECVQVTCVVNGTEKLPGDTWTSADECTSFECIRQLDGALTISASQETCPDVSDCPTTSLWNDNCCIRCNLTTLPLKTEHCEPVPVAVEDTIGLVVQVRQEHGRCRNIDPIDGFTECRGQCISGTFFNQKSSIHESTCACCQAVKFIGLPVELICPDGYSFKKQVAVPSECVCGTCASKEIFSNKKQPTKS